MPYALFHWKEVSVRTRLGKTAALCEELTSQPRELLTNDRRP